MTDEQNEREDFQRALPWYVSGTLDPGQRAKVDRYLSGHPEAAAELRWHARMREAVRRDPTAIPADLGWDEFAQRHGLLAAGHRPAASAWAGRPAFAMAAAVLVLVQAGVIGALLFDRHAAGAGGFSTHRSPAAGVPAREQVLQLRFKPGVSELDARKLLLGIDARLVGGPSQLGDYLVAVAPERIEAVRRGLENHALVAEAAIVALPAGGTE